MCLHLGQRGFSNEILFFYLTALEKIQNLNIGINIKQDDKLDIDAIPYVKALDGFKLVFEDKLPLESYNKTKSEIDKITVNKDRSKVVDLDKLLEIMV